MLSRANLPALSLALVALFAALAGGAIAAKRHYRIDGKMIRARSIPAAKLKPHSIGPGQLKAGVLAAPSAPPSSVANADHAITADSASNADHAASADVAGRLSAACPAGTRAFGGGCWEVAASAAAKPSSAAVACAARGGALPEALQLAAFAHEPGVSLAAGGEWTAAIILVAGPGIFAVATVDQGGDVDSDTSTASRAYRCVLPLAGA